MCVIKDKRECQKGVSSILRGQQRWNRAKQGCVDPAPGNRQQIDDGDRREQKKKIHFAVGDKNGRHYTVLNYPVWRGPEKTGALKTRSVAVYYELINDLLFSLSLQ